MELVKAVSDAEAVVVSGESGVGKSALAVLGLTAAGDTDPDGLQALCINLRQIPRLGIEFETALGHPLSTLLGELSAPQRMLVVDGADAAAEDRHDAFRCQVGAARESAVKVVVVTSILLSLHIYNRAFDAQLLGYASAIAVLLIVIVFGLSAAILAYGNPVNEKTDV